MTITRSDNFESFQSREGTPNIFLVFLYNGNGYWWVSTQEITGVTPTVTGTTVYALLKNNPTITQSVDLYSHRSSIGHTTISLVNKKYRQDSNGDWVSLSDEGLLAKDGETTVTIYVSSGYHAELADFITVFSGTVIGEPKCDGETITLEAEAAGSALLRTKLPVTPVQDVSSNFTEALPRLPLVFGDWSGNTDFGGNQCLVKCNTFLSGTNLVIIPSDYQINFISALWVYIEEGDLWIKLDNSQTGMEIETLTSTTWDDGVKRRYAILDINNPLMGWLFIPPHTLTDDEWGAGVWDSGDFKDGSNNVGKIRLMSDGRKETGGLLYQGNVPQKGMVGLQWDNVKNNGKLLSGYTYYENEWYWRNTKQFYYYVNLGHWVMNSNDIKLLWNISTNPELDYEWKVCGDTTEWFTNMIIRFPGTEYPAYFENCDDDSIFNGATQTLDLTNLGGYNFAEEIGWLMGDNKFEVNLTAKTTSSTNKWMLKLNEIALRLYATISKTMNTETPIYAEVKGMTAGSNLASRISGLSESSVIEWAGYQIERLLRIMGVSSFDTDLNDSAYNSNLKTRAIIDDKNKITLEAFLQELSENSNIVPMFDISGGIRFVAIDQTAPSSPEIISYTDLIKAPTLSITARNLVVNRLSYKYFPSPSSGYYAIESSVENAASQSTYGIREKTASFKYIYPDDITNLTDLLVGNSDAFLANRHYKVEFTTRGLSHIHLEIGDWMQFDAESLDPHMKFAEGNSWSGEKFLIIGKSIVRRGVTFSAIQLT